MKQYLLIIFSVFIIASCNSNSPINSTVAPIVTNPINNLQASLRRGDSVRNALLKITFAAGYMRGVNTGINNSNATIPDLYKMVSADSLKFAKIVDASYPINNY